MTSSDGFHEDDWDIIPDSAPVKFNSMEHADIPSQCLLKMTANPNDKGVSGRSPGAVLFRHEKEQFDVTFAFVIAVAGDFFSTDPPAHTIGFAPKFDVPVGTDGKLDGSVQRFESAVKALKADKTNLFIGSKGLLGTRLFSTYGLREYLGEEVSGLELLLADQPTKADLELEDGDPKAVQNKGSHNVTQAYVTKTDGVISDIRTVGRIGKVYGDIVLNNMDHFGEDAWKVYKAGHTIALRIAKAGGGPKTDATAIKAAEKQLKEAYLYDAFALHYLTDQFASGHVRAPREELNKPSFFGTVLTGFNKVLTMLPLGFVAPDDGVWDSMSGMAHDTDGAVGLRVKNRRGDEWITFGDKLYFAENNRINRLKSIECAQASIDEVWQTWRDGAYPAYLKDPDKDDVIAMCDTFKALQIAPLPMGHTIKATSDATGNPSPMWVVEDNPDQLKPRQKKVHGGTEDTTAQDEKKLQDLKEQVQSGQKDIKNIKNENEKDKAIAALAAQNQKGNQHAISDPKNRKPVGDARITGTPQEAENGFWFARRKDVESCACNEYQWGYPGVGWWGASSDVKWLQESKFNKNRWPKDARACETLSGGFIQIQEYAVDGGKVNYAVNVWGPVQVPKKFVTALEQQRLTNLGKPWQNDDRQMTFTFRGRKTALNDNPETASASKNLRWCSWYDGKSKTSLAKFSFSANDSALYVESWALVDPDSKVDRQWTNYENMTPKNMLRFGGPDKDAGASGPNSMNDITKSKLLPFTTQQWNDFGYLTRFFIFPFLNSSGRSNPDIVVFSYKTGTGATDAPKPVISVASTENGLIKPVFKLNSDPPGQFSSQVSTSLYNGFIKRFQDTNNKGVVLQARASRTDATAGNGVVIVPQVFWHDAENNKILVKEARLKMPMLKEHLPTTDDFYQILVGDTRWSGNREMVAVTGQFPHYYISAWELGPSQTWRPTSGPKNGPIPEIAEETYQDPSWIKINNYSTHMVNQFCALIPNEFKKAGPEDQKSTGQNVLLVTTYYSKHFADTYYWTNFRTFIKDGQKVDPVKELVEPQVPPPSLPNQQPSAPVDLAKTSSNFEFPNINTISTAKADVVKKDRPAAGWGSYIDCSIRDEYVNTVDGYIGADNENFKSMGWRLCKVSASVTGEPMYGVMQVFSFQGVLGCRVYAPRQPGEYHRWVCRGFQPYMGQTSLGKFSLLASPSPSFGFYSVRNQKMIADMIVVGTGYDAYGNWNDNASQLSWGATEAFADINVWNEYSRSWSEPAQHEYKRGFEAKIPKTGKYTPPAKVDYGKDDSKATDKPGTTEKPLISADKPAIERPLTNANVYIGTRPGVEDDVKLATAYQAMAGLKDVKVGNWIGDTTLKSAQSDPYYHVFSSFDRLQSGYIIGIDANYGADVDALKGMDVKFPDKVIQRLANNPYPVPAKLELAANEHVVKVEIKARAPDAKGRCRIVGLKVTTDVQNRVWTTNSYDELNGVDYTSEGPPAPGYFLRGFYGAENRSYICRLGALWGK